MRWVIVQEASSAPLVPQVTAVWLARAAAACEVQLNRDVAAEWGGAYAVRVGSSPSDVAAGEHVFAIVDQLPDAPGAVAYHDVDGQGAPVAFLALSTCSTLDDVSTAISHELVEAAGDPACNAWCDDGVHEWAMELADAVESSRYGIDLGDGLPPVVVSDWVLRAFFDGTAPGPYSYRQVATAPFTTAPGGYQIQRQSGSGETHVTAHASSKRGELVVAGKHHWSSRPARRGVPGEVVV